MPRTDYPDFVSSTGYGTVTGLCGVNCYHDYYPFIPGFSEPSYTDEELARLNAKEREKITFGGKQYDKYEATQRQRRLETTMRAQRQEIRLLEEGGADEDDIITARARYRVTSAEYARFSKEMDIPQQRERVTMDGLGNIGAGKYTESKEAFKARKLSVFNERNAPLTEHIDAEQVYENMQTSEIGQEYLKYAENLPEPIEFDYDTYIPGVRGENIGNRIVIYMRNEDNNNALMVARTVIHELTHYRYGIGGSQWSECVCIAHELMHKYNRSVLTFDEKKRIIKAVKGDPDYGKLNWRKGGIIHGRRKSH